jgi:hypothetical protein
MHPKISKRQAAKKKCYCGGAAGGGLRPVWALIPGHSLRDLPLVGTRGRGWAVAVTAVGAGSALANSSFIDTRSSSSSLEMMSGEVPPGRSDSSAQTYPP